MVIVGVVAVTVVVAVEAVESNVVSVVSIKVIVFVDATEAVVAFVDELVSSDVWDVAKEMIPYRMDEKKKQNMQIHMVLWNRA